MNGLSKVIDIMYTLFKASVYHEELLCIINYSKCVYKCVITKCVWYKMCRKMRLLSCSTVVLFPSGLRTPIDRQTDPASAARRLREELAELHY